ncbi:excalibur calcium-binding domain-containing protein [Sphingomonas koreensis]|jgi:Excalibur calcium-binding domain|nr:excalibur calcium-binding domain-containing protein [Sphingomonas koreensis]
MKRRLLLAALLAAFALGTDTAEAKRRSRGRGRRTPRTRARSAPGSGGGRNSFTAADSYPNCAAARAAAAAPIRAGDPGYSRRLDRDGDGIACE